MPTPPPPPPGCWASARPLVVATCGFAEQMLPTHCVPLSFLLSPFCPTSCFFLPPCLVSGFPILGPGGGPSDPWLWGPATRVLPGPGPAPAMKPLQASPALADLVLGPASSCVRVPNVASCSRSPGPGLAPLRSKV